MSGGWEFQFESLMKRLLDGQFCDADLVELEQLLAGNAEAAEAYLQFMTLDTVARECAKSKFLVPGKVTAAIVDDDSRLSIQAAESPAVSQQTTSSKSPVLGFLGGVMDYISHSRMLMLWLIAGGLGLYFVFQLGSLMISRFWAQNGTPLAQNGEPEPAKRGHADVATGKIVAQLTDAVDCQWEVAAASGGPLHPLASSLQAFPLGTDFHAGQKLTLASGLAELTFESGAKVILHAPARFYVGDAMGGRLEVGKLAAKVPHTAAGFTIATPGGKVVDLGTEFGVKVNDDGKLEVIVYVGDVKVEGSAPGAGGADENGSIHLSAGHAITIGTDHVAKPIPTDNERFVRDLAPLGDRTKVEAAYVEFMKSLKPVVWFRMEGKETERSLHDEMGGPDAKLNWDGPGNPFIKGTIGKGLWLRGGKLKDCAILDDYPKPAHGKFSVVAWAYAESQVGYATIAANWRSNPPSSQPIGQFEFGFNSAPLPCLGVFFMDANKTFHALEESSQPFPLYSWQHVAFTTDGATMRLYRQGHEVSSLKHNGLLFPSTGRTLGIGAKSCDDPLDRAGNMYWWDGKLDEVALFNDALSAEQIQRLAGATPR
jgi:hypothetical protein